jgi:hypothetical protein
MDVTDKPAGIYLQCVFGQHRGKHVSSLEKISYQHRDIFCICGHCRNDKGRYAPVSRQVVGRVPARHGDDRDHGRNQGRAHAAQVFQFFWRGT